MNPIATTIIMAKLILASAMFSYSYPKRKMFWLRLGIAVLIMLGAAFLLGRFLPSGKIFRFLNFLLQYSFMVVGVLVCFRVGLLQALALGAAAYATQHFCSNFASLIGVWFSFSSLIGRNLYPLSTLVEFAAFYLPIYVAFFFCFARYLKGMDIRGKGKVSVASISIGIILVCIGITRFSARTRDANTTIAQSLYAMVCCIGALSLLVAINLNSKLRKSETALRVLLLEKNRQFEEKKENAELMKIKLHDLRHHLQHLESILPSAEADSLQQMIAAYDSPFKTGNPILDIILTGINATCQSKKMSLTFIGEGAALSFLEEGELYSLVENACDNAIDAVSQLEEESRHISIHVETAGTLVMLNIINFYKGELSFESGLPKTTKQDDASLHGYGVLSMKRIAEKYQGGLSISAEGGIFSLTAYLQKPQE